MNFKRPYCNHDTTITDPNKYSNWNKIWIKRSTLGEIGFGISAITCPNEDCQQFTLVARLTNARFLRGDWGESTIRMTWHLLPESEARVLPDYIPDPIKEDYYEACRVRDLSPKASATLARRCLQGMIRDFWKISKSRLKDEVDALEEKVDADVWSSIDAVRSVGNIGAHMEKDINVIVEVDPSEAQLLIGLIEQLVDEWYVVREDRRKRAESLKNLAESKKVIPEQATGMTEVPQIQSSEDA